MTRTLIAYATKAGSTSEIAEIIAEELRRWSMDVTVANMSEQPDPEGYDLVVAGSAINGGAWLAPAIVWVTAQQAKLKQQRVAIFNVCLNAADSTKQNEALGYNKWAADKIEPFASTSFAGRYRPETVGFFRRLLLRSMSKAAQEHIDPVAIRTWARELVGQTII